MGAAPGRLVLRADAVFDVAIGALLALSTWDGLYDALDLPKPNPALLAQLGGIGIAALGYLLWLAGADAALRRPVATAAALANGAAAATIALWLIFKGGDDLYIGDGGVALLAAVAVALAAFAVAEARIAAEWRNRRGGVPPRSDL
jgi:hypothetical protein